MILAPSGSILGYVAAGALILGLAAGWTIRDWRCDAAYSKALEKADKQRAQMQGKIDAISQTYERERHQADGVETRTINTIREIYKTVPDVPADCAPDVRVYRMLESGVNRANANASGQPVDPVPVSTETATIADRP